MVNFLGEILIAVIRAAVAQCLYALWVKLAIWLDPKLKGRWAKLLVGGVFGLMLYFAIPAVLGLLGL